MFNPWPVVVNDLRRTWVGATAIVFLIALSTALGVAVSAQERALREGSAAAADAFDILIGAPGSETQLVLSTIFLQPAAVDLIDGELLVDLQNDPDVSLAAPIGFGDSWQGHSIVGTTTGFLSHLSGGTPEEGRWFDALAEAVVGIDVPLAPGDEMVPVHGQVVLDEDDDAHHGVEYRIVGRLPRLGNPWDRSIVVPIEAVWWVHGLPIGKTPSPALAEMMLQEAAAGGEVHRGLDAPEIAGLSLGPPFDAGQVPGVPAIVVEPGSLAAAYTLRQRYRSDDQTMALFPAEVLIQLYGVLGDVRDVMAWMSVGTQALVIAAMLLAILGALAQKRQLFGVLRALGASRSFVFVTVWAGVALLVAVGAVIGLAFGYAGARVVSILLEAESGLALPTGLSWQEVRLVVILMAVGIVLALLPSWLVYRQPVATALKG